MPEKSVLSAPLMEATYEPHMSSAATFTSLLPAYGLENPGEDSSSAAAHLVALHSSATARLSTPALG